MSRILLTVAMADGAIGKEEMMQLEKFSTYLGLEKKRLPSDLAFLASAVEPSGGEDGGKPYTRGIDRELILLRREEIQQAHKILDRMGIRNENLPSPEQVP